MRDKDMCFIKLFSQYCSIIPLAQRVFPDIKVLFLTRNGLKCVNSFERILTYHWYPFHFQWAPLKRFMIKARRKWLDLDEQKDSEIIDLITSLPLLYVASWAKNMRLYLDMHRADDNIRWTCYEDIVIHRERCIGEIFQYCGLDKTLANIGIRALKYDSQKNLDIKRTSQYSNCDKGMKFAADKICDFYGAPMVDETNITMPGKLKPI